MLRIASALHKRFPVNKAKEKGFFNSCSLFELLKKLLEERGYDACLMLGLTRCRRRI